MKTQLIRIRQWWRRIPFETKVDGLRGVLAMAIGITIFLPTFFILAWDASGFLVMVYQVAPALTFWAQVWSLVMLVMFTLVGINTFLFRLGWKFAALLVPYPGCGWRRPIKEES